MRLHTLLVPCCLVPGLALAGDPGGRNPFEEPDESEFFKFDQKLVTVATRFAQSPRKAPNIVSVIDARQIRERGYRTVSDALRDLPGAYVWPSAEGRQLVALRGIVSADNNKVLLLVDGIPLYDGVYTHAWIDEYLPLHHVRQIELIEGPGSAIYGTNAFAGVINIVTWKGGDLKGGRVRALVGAGDRVDVGVTAGDAGNVLGVDVAASIYARAFTQEGQGLATTPRGRRDVRAADPKSGVAVGTTIEIENLTARLHHIDYRHAFLTAEQDDLFDVFANDTDGFGLFYRATIIDVSYAFRPVPELLLTPRLTSQRHDNPGLYGFWDEGINDEGSVETLDLTMVETEKDTRWWAVGLTGELRPHPDHVTVGGIGFDETSVLKVEDVQFSNFERDGVVTDFRANPGDKLRNAHAFAAHTWTLGAPAELTLGGRVDKRFPANASDNAGDDAFRLLVSPRVGLVLTPIPAVNAKVLYGRAFRHANVRETLVQGALDDEGLYPFSSGSLDLRPEQIDTVDVEIEGRPDPRVTLRGAGSFSTLTVEIDKVTPPNQYQNLAGSLSIATGEAEVIYSIPNLEARAAYTLTIGTYGNNGPYAGRAQFEVPPHMVKGNLTLRADERWSMTLVGEGYSARPRSAWTPDANLEDGAPFGLLHATVFADKLGKSQNISVQASVRNVLDTQYDTAVYRDEINRLTGPPDDRQARYPLQHAGEGRRVLVGVEVGF